VKSAAALSQNPKSYIFNHNIDNGRSKIQETQNRWSNPGWKQQDREAAMQCIAITATI
jgi:hypothetical protein